MSLILRPNHFKVICKVNSPSEGVLQSLWGNQWESTFQCIALYYHQSFNEGNTDITFLGNNELIMINLYCTK